MRSQSVVPVGFETVFSSIVGGDALRARLLDVIADAASLATTKPVEVNVMTFSFTDPQIADALAAAAQRPRLTVQLISDWTQRADDGIQQAGRLTQLGLPNLTIRYKKDQPYVWDASAGRMRWSYHASKGLLHHKTLCVVVEGRPWRLVCGSFNWTAKAAHSYENLVVVTDSTPECRDLMSRVENEFRALWCDDSASMSADDAQAHYQAIAESYRQTATAPATFTDRPRHARPERLRLLTSQRGSGTGYAWQEDASESISPDVLVAFTARLPHEESSRAGYAETNRTRTFTLCTPAGTAKRVPLTITALALDVIYRARPGETLLIAMHGLSIRVPEYGALLDAARRGVRLRVLLDRKVGKRTAESLSRVRQREQLSIQVKGGCRMMHQKYVVNVDSPAVLTGTANMSTDASTRHSEHRIRVLGDESLANQFAADFETIWNRVTGQI
jgi:phosphatidylserine/phosphatidylglycerophosphate/cardiolipin synthase-like enzyme